MVIAKKGARKYEIIEFTAILVEIECWIKSGRRGTKSEWFSYMWDIKIRKGITNVQW